MRSVLLRRCLLSSRSTALDYNAVRLTSRSRHTFTSGPEGERELRHRENVALLRFEDQRYLQRTLDILRGDLDHARKLRHVLDAAPPVDAPKHAGPDAARVRHSLAAAVRQNDALARAIGRSIEHHKDLQHAPYPDRQRSKLRRYEEQVAKMTATERDEALMRVDEELKLEERDWNSTLEKLEGLLVDTLGRGIVDSAKRAHERQTASADEWEDIEEDMSRVETNAVSKGKRVVAGPGRMKQKSKSVAHSSLKGNRVAGNIETDSWRSLAGVTNHD